MVSVITVAPMTTLPMCTPTVCPLLPWLQVAVFAEGEDRVCMERIWRAGREERHPGCGRVREAGAAPSPGSWPVEEEQARPSQEKARGNHGFSWGKPEHWAEFSGFGGRPG